MNYSSFPTENQSGIPKLNLLYNQKKNNKANPSILDTKKKSNQKVRFTKKESEKNIEHFANPKKRESSHKKDSSSQKDLDNENTNTPSDTDSDTDDTNDDANNDKNEETNEEVSPETEKKKPRSFLSRIISGLLTIVFFVILGAIIYIGYMYFIKKKNIFASEEIVPPEIPSTENILESPETFGTSLEENISATPIVTENTKLTPVLNESLQGENEMIGKDTEMTGGDKGIVTDIINILKKFQN